MHACHLANTCNPLNNEVLCGMENAHIQSIEYTMEKKHFYIGIRRALKYNYNKEMIQQEFDLICTEW